MRTLTRFMFLLAVAIGPSAAAFQVSGKAATSADQPAPNQAEKLLDELERVDGNLETLRARVQYTKTFAIQGDRQERRGTLYYERGGEGESPDRRFAIRFEELVVGQRLEREEQFYVFDGEWVVEKVPSDRQFTKRQVVPPGESFDPLRIGEGPFPVPIGQRKKDITDRFHASVPDVTEGLPEWLHPFAQDKDIRQLHLVPREGTTEADDFERVRVWYRRMETPGGTPTLIPQIARAIEPIGDESLVILTDILVNQPIEDEVFDTSTPPRGAAWNVHIQPWRQAEPE